MDNYKGSFTGLRRPVRVADHSPPTNIKFQKGGSYVSIPPYAFMTCTGNKDDAVAAYFQVRHRHSPGRAEETKWSRSGNSVHWPRFDPGTTGVRQKNLCTASTMLLRKFHYSVGQLLRMVIAIYCFCKKQNFSRKLPHALCATVTQRTVRTDWK